MILAILNTYRVKRQWISRGEYVDVPYNQRDFDAIFPIPALTPEQQQMDFIEWPLPKMSQEQIKQNLKALKFI